MPMTLLGAQTLLQRLMEWYPPSVGAYSHDMLLHGGQLCVRLFHNNTVYPYVLDEDDVNLHSDTLAANIRALHDRALAAHLVGI